MASLKKLTDKTKLSQIQENFVTYFRLFAGIAGIHYVEGDVTWNITDEGAPGNLVLKTQFQGEALDEFIDETIAEIGKYADGIDWMVFPICQPGNLADRIKARGLEGGPDGAWELTGKIGGPGGNWMLADLTNLGLGPSVSDRFRVVRVDDEESLEAWRLASCAGFGGGSYHNFYEAYARHGFAQDAQAHHYIGYLDDQPVTSGTLLMAGGSASLYNISTPDAVRRQGFGGAITYFMMKEMQHRGYDWTWIMASNEGKGVYANLGYVPTDFGIREYRWQRRKSG
ncbi:MAG: hypothetical protein AAF629_22915 [Chloroflexota bacterium]